MEAGLSDYVSSVEELVALLDVQTFCRNGLTKSRKFLKLFAELCKADTGKMRH